jgi:hypothetical protein
MPYFYLPKEVPYSTVNLAQHNQMLCIKPRLQRVGAGLLRREADDGPSGPHRAPCAHPKHQGSLLPHGEEDGKERLAGAEGSTVVRGSRISQPVVLQRPPRPERGQEGSSGGKARSPEPRQCLFWRQAVSTHPSSTSRNARPAGAAAVIHRGSCGGFTLTRLRAPVDNRGKGRW